MGGWRCGQEVQVMAVPQDPKGSDPRSYLRKTL
jgi:hypothetical protein